MTQQTAENTNIIRETRKKLGLSQIGLASKLNVCVTTIQNWEHGRTIPWPPLMNSLARILEIDYHVLKQALKSPHPSPNFTIGAKQ